MRISVLTYNTANQQSTLSAIQTTITSTDSDIIFICLQEMYNLGNAPIPFHKKGYNVSCTKMIGLLSILMTKENSKLTILKIGMGFFSLPNKGFILYKSKNSLFINCHLPAHEHNNNKRMKMIEDIFDIASNYRNIDTIVLAGDMNFRVLNSSKNVELLKNKDFEKLKLQDQCQAFINKYKRFKEGKFNFKPTFKYNIGDDKYNLKRFPSWCDRIFVASKYKNEFNVYTSKNIKLSDHRPVYAEIEIFEFVTSDKNILNLRKVRFWHKVMLTHVYCFIYENTYQLLIAVMLIIAIIAFKKMCKSSYL